MCFNIFTVSETITKLIAMKPSLLILFTFIYFLSEGQQSVNNKWITFENTQYGYKFSYPSDWKIKGTSEAYIMNPISEIGNQIKTEVSFIVGSNDNDSSVDYIKKIEKTMLKSLNKNSGFQLLGSRYEYLSGNAGLLTDYTNIKTNKDTERIHSVVWRINKGVHVFRLAYWARSNMDAKYLATVYEIYNSFSFLDEPSRLTRAFLRGRWEGTITEGLPNASGIKPYPFTIIFKGYDKTKMPETIQLVDNWKKGTKDTLHTNIEAYIIDNGMKILYYQEQLDKTKCYVELYLFYNYKNGGHYLAGNNNVSGTPCYNISLSLKKVSDETELPKAELNSVTKVNPIAAPKENEPHTSSSVSEEKKAVKDAAIAFLKWYERIGEKQNMSFSNFVLSKYGKSGASEEDCPCTLNQKAINAYTTWIKANGTFISDVYLENYNKRLPAIEKYLKTAKTFEDGFQSIEDAYVANYLIYLGNGGNPDFNKLGFYTDTDKVKWEINVQPDGNAITDITYPGSEEKMRMEMVKENGLWKLAKPVRPLYDDSNVSSQPQSAKPENKPEPAKPQKDLSPAAAQLFKTIHVLSDDNSGAIVNLEISTAEKNMIVKHSGLKLNKDGKLFIVNDDDKPFEAAIDASDFNGDGKYELVLWKHDGLGPMKTSLFTIYYKTANQNYKDILTDYGFPVASKNKVNGFYLLTVAEPGMTGPSYKWDGSKYQSAGNVSIENEKEKTPLNVSKLIGGSTPEELGKTILKALKTNNKDLWMNCLHPTATTYRNLSERRFKEFREWLEEDGVSDWTSVNFSRVTYNKTGFIASNDNGEVNGEQVRRVFVIEFTYKNKEFLGGLGSMTIETYKGGNYFIFFPGKDTRLMRYKKK